MQVRVLRVRVRGPELSPRLQDPAPSSPLPRGRVPPLLGLEAALAAGVLCSDSPDAGTHYDDGGSLPACGSVGFRPVPRVCQPSGTGHETHPGGLSEGLRTRLGAPCHTLVAKASHMARSSVSGGRGSGGTVEAPGKNGGVQFSKGGRSWWQRFLLPQSPAPTRGFMSHGSEWVASPQSPGSGR